MARKKRLTNFLFPRIAFTSAKGIEWYEVTWYSQLAAIVVCFGMIPALSFYIGLQYKVTEIAIGPFHCMPPVE